MVLFLSSLFAVAANAQVYLGGQAGFSAANRQMNDNGNLSSSSGFTLSPYAGFYRNDRFDVGLGLSLGRNASKDYVTETDWRGDFYTYCASESKTIGWSIAPYARYSFLQLGRFEVIGMATVWLGASKVTTTLYPDPEGSGSYYRTPEVHTMKATAWGIDFAPVLAYNLTDHIEFSTTLNFASLGYSRQKIKDGLSSNNFGLNVNTGDVKNLGDIQIGFLYKF